MTTDIEKLRRAIADNTKALTDIAKMVGTLKEPLMKMSLELARFISLQQGKCTCPWLIGPSPYTPSLGHNINCPALKEQHTIGDECGDSGHLDKEN